MEVMTCLLHFMSNGYLYVYVESPSPTVSGSDLQDYSSQEQRASVDVGDIGDDIVHPC